MHIFQWFLLPASGNFGYEPENNERYLGILIILNTEITKFGPVSRDCSAHSM